MVMRQLKNKKLNNQITSSFLKKSSDSVSCIDYLDAHLDQAKFIGKSVEFDFINEDRSILSWHKRQGTRYATSVYFLPNMKI